MTVCVLRDSGVQIALCLVTAKMELPALQMMGSVSVHQDTEAPLAREVSTTEMLEKSLVSPSVFWKTYHTSQCFANCSVKD